MDDFPSDQQPIRLLITGVPCTGKTTFTKWLVENFAFIACQSDHDPQFLERAVAAVNDGRNIVLDWGIPAGALPFAKQFIDQNSFQAWWFDGDIETAKQIFINRPGHPATLANWDVYIAGLRSHASEYASLYGDRRIRTLDPGPKRMPNEAIWQTIKSYRTKDA